MLVLAKGVGATHLAPCTIDVLGYAPERVERPGEALARPGRETTRTRWSGAEAVEAALDWFGARCSGYVGQPRREPAAADRGRRAASRRRSCRRRWPRATCGRGPVLRRRLPRAEGLPRARCWPTTWRRSGDRGARGRARRSLRRAAPTSTRSASRARSTTRRSAPTVVGALSSGSAPRSGSRSRRCSGIADAHAVWTRHAGAARAAGVRGADAAAVGARHARRSRCCASALRRAGGTLILNAVVRRRRARRRARDRGARAGRAARRQRHGCDWVVLATGGFAVRRRSRSTRTGRRTRSRSGCRSAACPAGRARSARSTSTSSRWRAPGVAVDREPAARTGIENVLVVGRDAGRRRSRGARSPATGSRCRPATARPS